MCIRDRVQAIAHNFHFETGKALLALQAESLPHGYRVKQRLRWVLVGAITGVDNGGALALRGYPLGQLLRCTRGRVTHDDRIGADAIIMRHPSSGAPQQLAQWVAPEGKGPSVINAGDGAHQHPTQALLDAVTMRQRLGLQGEQGFAGLKVKIVGDCLHSVSYTHLTLPTSELV